MNPVFKKFAVGLFLTTSISATAYADSACSLDKSVEENQQILNGIEKTWQTSKSHIDELDKEANLFPQHEVKNVVAREFALKQRKILDHIRHGQGDLETLGNDITVTGFDEFKDAFKDFLHQSLYEPVALHYGRQHLWDKSQNWYDYPEGIALSPVTGAVGTAEGFVSGVATAAWWKWNQLRHPAIFDLEKRRAHEQLILELLGDAASACRATIHSQQTHAQHIDQDPV